MSEQRCQYCGVRKVSEEITLNTHDPPPFIALQLEDRRLKGEGACEPKLTETVTIGEGASKVKYKLRGLIYWDKDHFTCRLIGRSRQVYFNDGKSRAVDSIHEGGWSDIQDWYNTGKARLTYIILSLV